MKKIAPLILVAALPLAFVAASPGGGLVAKVDWLLAQFGEGTAVKEDAGRAPPLGTIISSALPYDLMPEGFRKTWYPADGRSVEGTAFGKLLTEKVEAVNTYPFLFKDGKPKAPDLRGVFLRGLNVFDSSSQQQRAADQSDPDSNRNVGDYQPDLFKAHDHNYKDGSVGGNGTDIQGGSSYPRRDTDRKTAMTGGQETRPKNAAVFYYIRVN